MCHHSSSVYVWPLAGRCCFTKPQMAAGQAQRTTHQPWVSVCLHDDREQRARFQAMLPQGKAAGSNIPPCAWMTQHCRCEARRSSTSFSRRRWCGMKQRAGVRGQERGRERALTREAVSTTRFTVFLFLAALCSTFLAPDVAGFTSSSMGSFACSLTGLQTGPVELSRDGKNRQNKVGKGETQQRSGEGRPLGIY